MRRQTHLNSVFYNVKQTLGFTMMENVDGRLCVCVRVCIGESNRNI